MNRRKFLLSLPAIGLGLMTLVNKALSGDSGESEAVLDIPTHGLRHEITPPMSHNVGFCWNGTTTMATYNGGLTWEVVPEMGIEQA